jgi:hypothetical protein
MLARVGPSPADTVPLGMISVAERAHVGEAAASEGSTIYEGDRLSTESAGVMRINSPGLTLQLDGPSSLVLHRPADPDGRIMAELASGTLVFSAARTCDFVVGADNAMIRPVPSVSAIAHIRIVNKRELRIYAKRGALEFSYRGESDTILEGSAYRVLLDPSETEARVLSESDQVGKTPPAKHYPTFVLSAIGVALGVGIPVLRHHLESPDRPGRK